MGHDLMGFVAMASDAMDSTIAIAGSVQIRGEDRAMANTAETQAIATGIVGPSSSEG
jgi:hypothetical protein